MQVCNQITIVAHTWIFWRSKILGVGQKTRVFLPLVWKNAFGAKNRRRSYLFAPQSGMFACWSGIFACWSGIFACRFGEIEGNTQIEQKKAVGKKHAQLPQKAIRSEKAEFLSMQEGPGIMHRVQSRALLRSNLPRASEKQRVTPGV